MLFLWRTLVLNLPTFQQCIVGWHDSALCPPPVRIVRVSYDEDILLRKRSFRPVTDFRKSYVGTRLLKMPKIQRSNMIRQLFLVWYLSSKGSQEPVFPRRGQPGVKFDKFGFTCFFHSLEKKFHICKQQLIFAILIPWWNSFFNGIQTIVINWQAWLRR